MSKMLACTMVAFGTLAYTPSVSSAQLVTVSAVFDMYTGAASTAGNINGTALTGTSLTNFAFNPSSQVDFSDGFTPANQLKFTSSGPQTVAAVGVEFLLGTITYTNGDWYTGLSSFHVRFTTSSLIAAYNNQVLDDFFVLNVTPNSSFQTPLQNADFVYFNNHPGLGSIRVFEGFDSGNNNTGTVSFYGKIGSLIPTRFADATGGATIVNSIDAITSPEPSTYTLMFSGLGVILVVARRRSRNTANRDG